MLSIALVIFLISKWLWVYTSQCAVATYIYTRRSRTLAVVLPNFLSLIGKDVVVQPWKLQKHLEDAHEITTARVTD